MCKQFSKLAVGATVIGSAASLAAAALLGIIPNPPEISFGPTDSSWGITTYIVQPPSPGLDAYGLFSANSNVLFIMIPGNSPSAVQQIVAGEMMLDFWVKQATGQFLDGQPGKDFRLDGTVIVNDVPVSGRLLEGEVSAFGFYNEAGNGLFDMRITPVGGLLAAPGMPFHAMDIGIQLTSEGSNFSGSFNTTSAGNAKGVIGAVLPVTGGGPTGGCTPGFWKQPHHFCHWPTPYLPNTPFKNVFGNCTKIPGNPTLAEALRLNGGGINALMRHSTAALLNAASSSFNPDPAFDTAAEVIAAFQNACDSNSFEDTKNLMEASNEIGCPLSGNCN